MENLKRILVCPNAFKGSLSASMAAEAISIGVRRAFGSKKIVIDSIPLSDGGDSFLETMVTLSSGVFYTKSVKNPLGVQVDAKWGRLGGDQGDTAVVEMALASGLALLQPYERNPLIATTFGTGELILEAIKTGHKRLMIGIGGSATNDGGAGAMKALGAEFFDANGTRLSARPRSLYRLARIDVSGFRVLRDFEIIVACDVTNPLCGPNGATEIYGAQKGVTGDLVPQLDDFLKLFAKIMKRDLGANVANVPGAGAAGGLGAGLMAFCGAKLRSGIDILFEASQFDERLKRCQLVITGEGKLDSQTAQGKAIAGVAKRAKALRIPVIALAGAMEWEAEAKLRKLGVTSSLSICDSPMSLDQAMQDSETLLANAAERAMRLLLL